MNNSEMIDSLRERIERLEAAVEAWLKTTTPFEEMVTRAEAGQEIACQSFKAGYTAIWYEADDGMQYQVQYEAGEAASVQIVGEKQVFFPA